MKHIYINNKSPNTLILLHGTGGDEHDLLQIASHLDKEANILSFRGNIVENGKNRFFKRLGMGIYDLESYELETNNLLKSIKELSSKYEFQLENTTVVGFSNGANIALGLIQTNNIVNNYILYSPDFINPNKEFPNLEGVNIFISTADNDPFVNPSNMQLLTNKLIENNANLEVFKQSGHQLTMNTLNESKRWYSNL